MIKARSVLAAVEKRVYSANSSARSQASTPWGHRADGDQGLKELPSLRSGLLLDPSIPTLQSVSMGLPQWTGLRSSASSRRLSATWAEHAKKLKFAE